ncbi:MAG: hypothetical protein GX600_01285 [Dehalococcoidia bacterium]|jgi:hypothetical protein|nr:hypothetical protein [Dehalococcoidia bacterium]
MKLPEYITVDEVKRVCRELGIRDWTTLKKPEVTNDEASRILVEVNVTNMPVTLADFKSGLEVELEHGVVFPDANVTNNHPILTGKIVMAHFKESLDYYQRLDVAEIEGDMAKAAAAGSADKLLAKYRKLVVARRELAEAENRLVQ